MSVQTLETDVLVIGGGGAGFRAAIGAREKDATVILVSKGPLGRCGATPMAGADFTLDGKSLQDLKFSGAPDDSYEKVFNDIVTQGFYLNNQKLVDHYIRSAPGRLKELLDWGLVISFSEERAVFSSGIDIMDVLLQKARSVGVGFLEDVMVIDLIVNDGCISGALGLDIKTGNFYRFIVKSVVLASGGWHKAFWPNTGMKDLSGDGIAMAFRAGASIGNMEFITFCCNIFYDPPIWRGSLAPYILGMMAGHRLTDSDGNTFLDAYDPYIVETASRMEWNKSFISMASAKEVREGRGGPNGGIFFDCGDVPWETIDFFSGIMFPKWKYKGLDLSDWGKKLKAKEPVEVGPAVEYFDGGIVVDDRFETTISGLYAAGECALGLFGANRVFSAITEMLVQGMEAGQNAGAHAVKNAVSQPSPRMFEPFEEKATRPLRRADGPGPALLMRSLQESAHKHLGPIRNEKELTSFIDMLDDAKKGQLPLVAVSSDLPAYNREWILALELFNMVDLLDAAARSAMLRTESRGVHFREDFPVCDNANWLTETLVKRENNEPVLHGRPACMTSMRPLPETLPYLEMMKKMMTAHSNIGGHH